MILKRLKLIQWLSKVEMMLYDSILMLIVMENLSRSGIPDIETHFPWVIEMVYDSYDREIPE